MKLNASDTMASTAQGGPADSTGPERRAIARRVLRTEAEALLVMADDLPTDFDAAIQMILGLSGRLITSGMGKSGHIARKIAATLASTGTPSFFVHPAEASHGDLGMITEADACLLISNSGETTELADIIAHCLRFGMPIIGISKQNDSALMRAARYRLTLPDMPEACSIGMAPTTSTTLALGLGDALAVTLMEQRKFSQAHFRTFHPGGKLGAQLASVHQVWPAATAVPIVVEDCPMPDTILEMTAKSFGVVAVTGPDGKLVGVISDGDLRRNITTLMQRSAGEICNRTPVCVSPDMLAAEALGIMNSRPVTAIFVVDGDNRPCGILHLHDCLRAGVA
jgi:arabinose-5-phosphate isomerase